MQPRIETFGEIPEKLDKLAEISEYDLSLFDNKKNKTSAALAKELLPKIRGYIANIDVFENDVLYSTLSANAAEAGVKSGAFFWIMRIAITGCAVTPGGATEMAALFGKEETLRRIDFSLSLLNAE